MTKQKKAAIRLQVLSLHARGYTTAELARMFKTSEAEIVAILESR